MSSKRITLWDKLTGKAGKKLDPLADKEDIVKNPNELDVHGSLVLLTKDIGVILDKQFKGWPWVVQPDQRGRVINIWNYALSDEWGYTIRTVEIHNSPAAAKRAAITAGREILERFGIAPGPYRPEAMEGVKKDLTGKIIPKDAEDRMTRQQREKVKVQDAVEDIQRIIVP